MDLGTGKKCYLTKIGKNIYQTVIILELWFAKSRNLEVLHVVSRIFADTPKNLDAQLIS